MSVALVLGLAIWAGAAAAADGVSPLKLDLGAGWTARLGGAANLTFYDASQSGRKDRSGATAAVFLDPRLEKLFANGWRLGLRTGLTVYHDRLSGDRYGNDVFQKVYLFLHTPYGRIELGQQDGAAYSMAVTGPLVADDVALDDGTITFFRDPATPVALTGMFAVRSAVFATANAAKIAYYSPRLFGVQIGAAYTPRLVKDVLPFVGTPPHVADRQDDLVEAAINYTGYFGQTSFGAYAGLAAGHNAQQTPGHDGLFDWGLGAELDYDFGDTVLAVGGAWRQSNGYVFDPGAAMRHGTTHAVHASTRLSHGPWQIGFEYSRGAADGEAALPRLALGGYEASVGYALTPNLQLTGGWQHRHFTRDTGVFYNGARALDLDAGFLYLHIHV